MFPYFKIYNKIIPLYGLCITIGIIFAAAFMILDCKKRKLLWEDGVIISATGLGMGFLGAKLLYIFVTFTPMQLIQIIKNGNFNEISNGGFVFYGGLIFGILGAFLGAKIAKAQLKSFENILVKEIPFVHGFGRIGCFFAGCCYGKPTDSVFSVVFTRPISDVPTGICLIPVQIYEAFFNFVLFMTLAIIDIKKPNNKFILPLYLSMYSVERFIIEFFRYDYVRGGICGLSTSQWISIGIFVSALMLGIKRINNIENKSRQCDK